MEGPRGPSGGLCSGEGSADPDEIVVRRLWEWQAYHDALLCWSSRTNSDLAAAAAAAAAVVAQKFSQGQVWYTRYSAQAEICTRTACGHHVWELHQWEGTTTCREWQRCCRANTVGTGGGTN